MKFRWKAEVPEKNKILQFEGYSEENKGDFKKKLRKNVRLIRFKKVEK